MKVEPTGDLPTSALIGAVVTTADGCELGVVVDIRFGIADHNVTLWIRQDGNGINGIDWDRLADATLSLQSPVLTH